LRQTLIVIAS